MQAEKAGTVNPVLSIWQHRDSDHDLFYMVAECAPEEMSQPFRRPRPKARGDEIGVSLTLPDKASVEDQMNNSQFEVWLRMYEEQVRHARHHETLRTHSTNVIIIISAAILAFLSSKFVSPSQHVVFGFFLIAINVYGLILSLKHYERNQRTLRCPVTTELFFRNSALWKVGN